MIDVIVKLMLYLWILSEVIGGVVIPQLRRCGAKVKKNDQGSRLLIMVSMFLSIAIASFFARANIALLPSWALYLGIIFMLFGIILRQWSIVVLGRFFSGTVGIQKGQRVINNGPYQLVRHPSYTGLLLILIGLGLAVQSWGAIIVLLLLFGFALGYRIYVEEKVLISNLGNDYIEYMKRTKRLIPYVL